MNWWFADLLHDNPAMLVSWVVWVLLSICLHELGHGLAAIRLGDRTPIETGHMTWNPIVHMGWASLLVFAISGIAWGAMPISPSRIRGRHGVALVSVAGPAVNLGLAAASFIACALWIKYANGLPGELGANFRIFFLVGIVLNLALLAFNLMPVPPLDGSRILAEYFRPYRNLLADPRAVVVGLILMVVVGSRLTRAVMGTVTPAIFDWLTRVVDWLP